MKQQPLLDIAPHVSPINWSGMHTSVVFSDREAITAIMQLHNGGAPFDVDPCYSIGRFWRGLPEPLWKSDIAPQVDGVARCSADNLPLEDASARAVMFDPPFHFRGSKKSTGTIHDRFSAFETYAELIGLYASALAEFWRILEYGGIVAVKCQDFLTGGRQYMTHVDTCNAARDAGFYAKDLLILVNQNVMWSPNMANQQHARKTHSYYLVFQKSRRKLS